MPTKGVVAVAKGLVELGFSLVSTSGTLAVLREAGVAATHINKVTEGRPTLWT